MPDDTHGRRPEDLVPEDDAIIGRVFRRSLVVVVVLAAVTLGGWWLTREEAVAETAVGKRVGRIDDLDNAAPSRPAVRFIDVTAESGIDFLHDSGARGEKLLPETMGSGVAFLDYDVDGDADLLLVGARPWVHAAETPRGASLALYRNDGTGHFDDVTTQAGLDLVVFGVGAAVADYDADGDPDVFLATLGENLLLRNDAGRFVDVTRRAGVAGDTDAWSTSAGFFDHDADGDLDLFVTNYVRWSRQTDLELNFTLNGRDRAYGPPTNYEGAHPYLYRNEGNGRFTDVSAASGVQVLNPLNGRPMAKALGLTFVDLERDGYLDVFVANDTVQNFLLHNRGDGTFEEIGAVAGVGFDGAGNATGAMGIDAAYYRNDDQLAVAIGNFANETTSLYVSQRNALRFTDEALGEGVGAPSRGVLSFGLLFFDYDLDGRLDLLQANGHLEEEISQVQASQSYRQSAQLFWNAGPAARSCFVEVPDDSTGDLARPIVGRGASYADIDGDGDLDVVLTQAGGAPLLLRNDQHTGHHWVRFRLEGAGANREAIGAWVELPFRDELQRRQVMPTRSYASQVELTVTFGLDTLERAGPARVVWPDGVTQEVSVPRVDTEIRVVRAP